MVVIIVIIVAGVLVLGGGVALLVFAGGAAFFLRGRKGDEEEEEDDDDETAPGEELTLTLPDPPPAPAPAPPPKTPAKPPGRVVGGATPSGQFREPPPPPPFAGTPAKTLPGNSARGSAPPAPASQKPSPLSPMSPLAAPPKPPGKSYFDEDGTDVKTELFSRDAAKRYAAMLDDEDDGEHTELFSSTDLDADLAGLMEEPSVSSELKPKRKRE